MRELFSQVICPIVERRLSHRLAMAGAGRAALRDHVQEVLVHLLERDAAVLRRWDPARGPLSPFVAKVAENFMISQLRKRPPPSPSEELDEEKSSAETPEEGASFAHLVTSLLRELNEDDAALFHAIYMEELSPDEAASQLGISRDAVHKRIQRLRARLGEKLKRREVGQAGLRNPGGKMSNPDTPTT